MRVRVVVVLMIFISLTSCKATKERKKCIELTNGKEVLNISSFEELKMHIKGAVNYEKVLWIVDGRISSKEKILKLIENRNLLNVISIKGANGSQLGGVLNGIIIINSNECLEKIKLK